MNSLKYNKYLFDLDGVLVDTLNIQYNSTVKAISKYVNINLTEGLEKILRSNITTSKKLDYLIQKNIISKEQKNIIYSEKKKISNDKFKNLLLDDEKIKLFSFLKDKSCLISVVTNGNRKSAEIILKSLGLYNFLDLLISNQDVTNPKPHSEPYVKAISHFGGDLKDFIIFEDSETGLIAANGTGCKVYQVTKVSDINLDLIKRINNLNRNILIPAAGLGSRFQQRGFKLQKPLIELGNKTLIHHAISSLDIEGNYIFIIRKIDNNSNIKLIELLRSIKRDCKIIEIDYVTEGSASSCYLAKELIDNDNELIISNCDQILEWNSKKFLEYSSNYDCSVLTFKSNEKQHSYIKTDENNKGIEIKEKEVISDNALVGVHYFKKGSDFINSYEYIFKNKIKFKNEYYLSTVCNNLINQGKEVVNYTFPKNELYYSTGTPKDYFKYMRDHNLLNTKVYKMKDMFRGWYVGNFEPSAYKTTDFEAGYLLHKKGEQWDVHYHKFMTEVNFLVKGKMILNDIELTEGDIFLIDKKEIACPIFLEDCYIFVLKIPSVPGDKIIL